MAYVSALLPDDRDWLDALIDPHINGFQSVRNVEVASKVTAAVREAAEDGDEQAERVMAALVQDGVLSRTERRVKDLDRCTFQVSRSGKIIGAPARIGHRMRRTTGERERWYQQTLWYELPWDEFEVWLADRERHRDHLSSIITGYREALKLRERYPDTRTPLEACERAGIDPRAFGVDAA